VSSEVVAKDRIVSPVTAYRTGHDCKGDEG